jgi:predicted ester cyclase
MTVATRKSFLGTHQGDLFGVPATNKAVHIDVVDFVRVEDGRIMEHWNLVDSAGLMHQLQT